MNLHSLAEARQLPQCLLRVQYTQLFLLQRSDTKLDLLVILMDTMHNIRLQPQARRQMLPQHHHILFTKATQRTRISTPYHTTLDGAIVRFRPAPSQLHLLDNNYKMSSTTEPHITSMANLHHLQEPDCRLTLLTKILLQMFRGKAHPLTTQDRLQLLLALLQSMHQQPQASLRLMQGRLQRHRNHIAVLLDL